MKKLLIAVISVVTLLASANAFAGSFVCNGDICTATTTIVETRVKTDGRVLVGFADDLPAGINGWVELATGDQFNFKLMYAAILSAKMSNSPVLAEVDIGYATGSNLARLSSLDLLN